LRKTNSTIAAGEMIFSSIVWGASFVSMKICYRWFTPYSLLKYRLLVSTATLAVLLATGKRSFRLDKKDIPNIFLCGALGVFFYYLLEFVSIQWMSASANSILIGAIPVASLLATVIVSKAHITWRVGVSVVLSTLGIIIVSGFQREPLTGKFLLGVMMMLGAILSWVAYGFLSARLMVKYDSVVVTFYQLMSGALLSILFFPKARVNWNSIGFEGLLHLLFLGAIGSGVCYLMYNRAVRVLNVTVANTVMNFVPLVTIVVEALVFRRLPCMGTFVGGTLIIAAAMLSVGG